VAVPGQLEVRRTDDGDAQAVAGAELLLISLEGWKRAVEKPSPWLAHTPSSLIIRP